MTIGDIIKSRRKELNLRQEDLAELVETTKATVSRWESEICYPDIETLPQIADFFGVSMDEILCYDSVQKETKIGEYIDPVDFGDATANMDQIWQMLSEDWTNYKVFSGLFDIGYQTANITDGIDSDNAMIYEKHLLKATKLKETDIKSVVKNGNSYTVQLANCNNPQKDNKNALNRATDYFVVGDDIREYVSMMLGSLSGVMNLEQENFYFSSIILNFDVDKGVITNLKISYNLDAVMRMTMGTGTLSAKYELIYSDLNYDNVNLPEFKLNGWVAENGKWAYYENGVKATNKWLKDSVGWCYVGEDGYCVTNCWKADSVGWCYLDANGRMTQKVGAT